MGFGTPSDVCYKYIEKILLKYGISSCSAYNEFGKYIIQLLNFISIEPLNLIIYSQISGFDLKFNIKKNLKIFSN